MPALGSLPLARTEFDRDGDARLKEDFLGETLRDPETRLLFVADRQLLIDDGRLVFRGIDDLPEEFLAAAYLGRIVTDGGQLEPGTRVVAVVLAEPSPRERGDWRTLRDAAVLLDDLEGGLAVEAVAVAGWHSSATRCTRCGDTTSIEHAGWMRKCVSCGTELFPRTDPAVIVLITDEDDERILLGSNAMWPEGRYSLFAGFVEAGESLEAAVEREVFEEAGVRVVDPVYLGSQPWPFPQSLMLGFSARLAPGQDAADTRPDGEEILDVRWFTRDEIAEPGDDVQLPGTSSIAHAIIQNWRDGR
ncbi:NAD+ diphosphatase [Paramicrobacterium humi]|uniref:NAD(+) diphosphatase n=1 Tax=Paramicrobacterium humi TaxID=640635 RepID=A0A1H4TA16_9MICO|nr:NAD(+) diphosphatase [Microbacterium humi]SEC52971.1 NAD+ diphosphatase [Microbacterium humi]